MVAQPIAQPRAARAAIYVRVSTDEQEANYSLSTQEAACRRYADEHGYTVVEVYREVHTATELAERPALTRLREAMEEGQFDVMLCYDPDRFSRNQVHSGIMQYYCDRAGVDLKFAMFDYEQSATGHFLLQARVFAAELEHEKIRERTIRGARARVASGKLDGRSRAIYGYRYTDATRARLEINPDTAWVVRDIFGQYAGGIPTRRIAATLNERGIPTPASATEWRHSSVTAILKQRAYTGQAVALTTMRRRERGKTVRGKRPADEWVTLPEGTIPPLIDGATWRAVEDRFARNKLEAARHAQDPESFLLRAGYVVCGYCGKTLVSAWNPQGKGQKRTKYPVYRAMHDKHRDCAPDGRYSFNIPAKMIDRAAWEAVEEYMQHPERLGALIDSQDAGDPTAEALATVDRLLADAQKQQANLARALASVEDDEARAPLLAELQAVAGRKKTLTAERADLLARQQEWQAGRERKRELIDWWVNAAANLDRADYAGRRELLALLGVKVRVWVDNQYDVVAPPDVPTRRNGAIVDSRA